MTVQFHFTVISPFVPKPKGLGPLPALSRTQALMAADCTNSWSMVQAKCTACHVRNQIQLPRLASKSSTKSYKIIQNLGPFNRSPRKPIQLQKPHNSHLYLQAGCIHTCSHVLQALVVAAHATSNRCKESCSASPMSCSECCHCPAFERTHHQ